MKTTMIRFVVAGIIMASLGFLGFYYFAGPDLALSTYNQVSNLAYSDEFVEFDNNLNTMSSDLNLSLINGASENGYYKIVNNALKNNFNYYKNYLLFVSAISATDQANINSKIKEYEDAFLETNRLLLYFNNNLTVDIFTKTGMHTNFLNSYNSTIKIFVELVEALQDYVVKYSFNNTSPVGLRQTLLQVQLDFAKVIITEQLDTITDATLFNELNAVSNKFTNFNNAPQGSNANALNFIAAYSNFNNKTEYFASATKFNYVTGYSEEQGDYARAIYNFLNLASYN